MTSTIQPSDLLSAAKEHDEYLLALDEAKQWWAAEDKLSAVLVGLGDDDERSSNLDQAERWDRAAEMFDAQVVTGLRSYLVAEGRALPLPKPPPADLMPVRPLSPRPPVRQKSAAPGPVSARGPASTGAGRASARGPASAAPGPVSARGPVTSEARAPMPRPAARGAESMRPRPKDLKPPPAQSDSPTKADAVIERPATKARAGRPWRRRRKKEQAEARVDTPGPKSEESARSKMPPVKGPGALTDPRSKMPAVKGPGALTDPRSKTPAVKGPASRPRSRPKNTTSSFAGSSFAGRVTPPSAEPKPNFDVPIGRTSGPNGPAAPTSPRRAPIPASVELTSSSGGVKVATSPQTYEARDSGAPDDSQSAPAVRPVDRPDDLASATPGSQHRKGNFLIGAGAVLLFISLLGALFLRTSGTDEVLPPDQAAVAAAAAAVPVSDTAAEPVADTTAAQAAEVVTNPGRTVAPIVTFNNCGPERAGGSVENPLATAATIHVIVEFSDGLGSFNPVSLQLKVAAGETRAIDVPISGVSADASQLQCMGFVQEFEPVG